MSDSLLQEKLLVVIKESRTRYENQSAAIRALTEQIDQNDLSMNDKHMALQILLTLPMIEKYQKEKLPSDSSFKSMLKDQEKLIRQIENRTPKY